MTSSAVTVTTAMKTDSAGYSIASRLPISHREMANDCAIPDNPCTSRISAEHTLLVATPARSRPNAET